MKYEISEGQVTMPVSELNRLNKLAEDLDQREKAVVKREEDRMFCNIVNYPGYNKYKTSYYWHSIDDATAMMKKEIENLEKKNRNNKNELSKIKRMTAKQFLKWQKENK